MKRERFELTRAMSTQFPVSCGRYLLLGMGLALVMELAGCTALVSPRPARKTTIVPIGSTSGIFLDIGPQPALVDEKLSIRLGGLKPNQLVTLTAETRDGLGRLWQSYATFRTDNEGAVDPGSQMPESGAYNVVDPMGLFWSLHLLESGGSGDMNYEEDLTPQAMQLTLKATAEGQQVAATSIVREIEGEKVTRIEVNQDGLAGILYMPAGVGPSPGVIILGGAEGGLHADQAALLASHGFATLALAYFDYEGLPTSLENIPIEYLEKSIGWLQEQRGVRADSLALLGASRGGELALLLGSMFPEIKAVVAYVPASHLGPGDNELTPAWTSHGRPLPYVPDFDTIFAAARGDAAALRRAQPGVIHVEDIKGPVLLVSARDDRLWPSFQMSTEIMQRLTEYHHPYADNHLSYEGAGHLILQMIPYLPYTAQRDPPNVVRYINYYGGTISGDASALADSWPKVLSFLNENLK